MALPDILTGLLPGTAAEPDGVRSPPDPEPDGTRASVDASPAVVYECRNCGLTVDPDTDRCPSCDHDAIVEYPVD